MAQKKKTNGKDPAVLLYTQDFIVGTITMTHEQRGKYILLLCLQHQKGKLTLNDLRQYLNEEDILLSEKFPMHEDGFYYNDRMQMEIENRKVKSDSSRTNGTLGGRPPKTSILPDDKPNKNLNNNLKETYGLLVGKPKNNPAEDEAEDVNESEDDIEIVVDIEDKNVNVNLINKILDRILQYENTKLHKDALEDLQDCGGLDRISEILQWDTSVKNNHIRAINQSIEIHNNK
jgi:hypothetical protein